MSLDRCEEYVGPATPTGQRATCDRPSTFLATLLTPGKRVGSVVSLCNRHVTDYVAEDPSAALWRVVRIAGR